MLDIYGIKNCDTVKKSLKWLDAEGISYTFHDFKKEAPTEDLVKDWVDALGVDLVLNKRGTTWRKLEAADQAKAESVEGAVALIVEHSSMIKRPVIVGDGHVSVGFTPDVQAKLKG